MAGRRAVIESDWMPLAYARAAVIREGGLTPDEAEEFITLAVNDGEVPIAKIEGGKRVLIHPVELAGKRLDFGAGGIREPRLQIRLHERGESLTIWSGNPDVPEDCEIVPAVLHGPMLGARLDRKLKPLPSRRAGRPAEHDLIAISEIAHRRLALHGVPEHLADLVRAVAEEVNRCGDKCPDERALRRRLGPLLDRFRQGLDRGA